MSDYDNGLIIGLGKNHKDNIIEASKPILELLSIPKAYSPATIWTVLAYLGRINARDSKKRIVGFDNNEMKIITGINQFRTTDADQIKKELQTPRTLEWEDKDGRFNRVLDVVLWPVAGYDRKDDGILRFYLGCISLPETEEFFFRLSEYFQTKTGLLLGLGNRDKGLRIFYLYCYLLQNAYLKCWKESVDEIKRRLFCPDSQKNSTGSFNDKTFYPVVDYINENMNLKFEVNEIIEEGTKSHKIVEYEFVIKEMIPLSQFSFGSIEEKQGKEDTILKTSDDFIINGVFDYDSYEEYRNSLSLEQQKELDHFEDVKAAKVAKADLISNLKFSLADCDLRDKDIQGIAEIFDSWRNRKFSEFNNYENAIEELHFYYSKAVRNCKNKNAIGSYIISMMNNN